MFLIVFIEFPLIFFGKKSWLEPKTIEKVVIFRRVVCLILGKVCIILISSMDVHINRKKFEYMSTN